MSAASALHTVDGHLYMAWFDDTKGKPTEEKIADGARWYAQKHGGPPANVALVNARDEGCRVEGVTVRVSHLLRPNTFYFEYDPKVEVVAAVGGSGNSAQRRKRALMPRRKGGKR